MAVNQEQLKKSGEEKLSPTGFFSPQTIDLSKAPVEIIQYILGFVNFSDLFNAEMASKSFQTLVKKDFRLVTLRNLLKEKPKAKKIFAKLLKDAKKDSAAKNYINMLVPMVLSAPLVFKLSLALQILDHEMGVLHDAVNKDFKWLSQIWQIETDLKLTLRCGTAVHDISVSAFVRYLKSILPINCEVVQDTDTGRQYLCISNENLSEECIQRIEKVLISGGIALGEVLTCGHFRDKMTTTEAEIFLKSSEREQDKVTTILGITKAYDDDPVYLVSSKTQRGLISHQTCRFPYQLLALIAEINEESVEPHSEAQLSLS